jgi:four helix bundle protein
MELGKLDIYKLSLMLSSLTWDIYTGLPNDLKYNIGNQVIRSIDSIGANIAEGYGRFHYKDSIKFYYNARGSLWESKHWIYLLYKRELINQSIYNNLINNLEILGKKLNGFIRTIKATNEK